MDRSHARTVSPARGVSVTVTSVECLSADRILSYLEGSLDAEERPLVDAHVDACEECHAVVAAAGGGETEARALETPLLNGDVIRQFVILGWLGRGGMGVVYDAYDRVLDRRVALKLMRPEAENREALLHEAKLAAKVSSPHAVVVYQADLEGDQVFVAMERVAGSTLREVATHASPEELTRAILEAGAGLVDVHEADIAHGDFKPENVLVGPRGAKISDFGLAHAAGQRNRPAGTPRYAAPEQAVTGASPAADQFAFAVTAWELLTGHHPYLRRWDRGPVLPDAQPPAPTVRGAEKIPRRLRAALLRALSVDAALRFPTMRAMLAAAAEEKPRAAPFYALLAGLAVLGVFAAALARTPPANPCHHLDPRLASVWNEARKAKLDEVLRKNPAPHAGALWQHVAQQLDQLAEAWRVEREEVCTATAIRKDLSPPAAEIRVACLDEVLSDWDAQLALMTSFGSAEVDDLPSVVSQLPRPAQCRRATSPTEASPQRSQLYQVRALKRAARVNETLESSRRLQASLDGARSPDLAAELLALEGWALARSSSPVAVAKLQEALSAAERARDDALRASILVDLIFAYQQRGSDAELPMLESLARSALQRAPSTPMLASELDRSLGRAASRRGLHRRALALFERALQDLLALCEPGDILTVPVRLSIALELGSLGQWPELVRQTQSIQRELTAQYPDHPLLVPTAINLSHGYLNLRELEKARATAAAGIEGESAKRAPAPQLGVLHANRALAYAGLHQPLLATQDIARARDIFEKSGGDKGGRVGETWLAQFAVEQAAGRATDAVEAAERAEAIFAAGASKEGLNHARGRLALAEAYEASRAAGDEERARTNAEAALLFFERLGDEGNPEELAKAQFIVARLLSPADRERTQRLLGAARTFYASRPWLSAEATRAAAFAGRP